MTELTAETRRLIALARDTDVPPPSAERAVRDRLIAQLGVAALAGATASTVTAGASGVGVGALSGSAPSTMAVGTAAAKIATASGTSALMKTLAALVLVSGLGTGAMQNDTVAARAHEWTAEAAVEAEQAAKQIWQIVAGRSDEAPDFAAARAKLLESPLGFDERRHALLVRIARRPDRPVAKEAELVFILAAEDALADGDAALATRYLDQHEARFAQGALSDNRAALRVLVDCARGAAEKARAGAEKFVKRFPASDQLERLRACAFTAPIVETQSKAPSTLVPSSGERPNF